MREGAGERAAQIIDHLKKGDMAKEAERLLADSGWLPEPLRLTEVEPATGSAVEGDGETEALPVLGQVLFAFLLFLGGAAVIGIVVAHLFSLPVPQTRTLVFSVATRNSFVVLPFALALPSAWDMAVIVIVFQSLVELFGMVGFLWLVPRKLLPLSESAS